MGPIKRIKTIDTIRGLSMLWMFIGHLSGWWMAEEDMYIAHLLFAIFDPIGASAFIFISGISTCFSVRNRQEKSKILEDFNSNNIIRKEYFIRAFLIFGLAMAYNLVVAFFYGDMRKIWSWFVLLTIAVSLFLTWPLLNKSIITRILVIILVLIGNQILLIYLLPYQNEKSMRGILFYLLYNSLDLDFILGFFPFFLLGTIIGDLLHGIYNNEDILERRESLKIKILYPSLFIAPCLLLFGMVFQLRLGDIYGHGTELFNFPDFLISRSFSWFVYTFGILLLLSTSLLVLEEAGAFDNEKNGRFLFYFSYYSLTVYLAHNILFFLFLGRFQATEIWFPIFLTIIMVWFLLRALYRSKWRTYLSLKIQIGRLSSYLARL
ncbi:MAG: heparan-alpha-glucosaminide N-acetyltransferase domain-containing protein [Promethearchaeota archaeon]